MKLLRETVRRIILEGLRFDEDLMILNHPKSPTLYLLCDAQWEHCMQGSMFDKERFFQHNVLAMIQVRTPQDGPCNGAMEIKKSAAIDGYGPTLYDCVMELTDGIINDRDSVSSSAKRVMLRYKNDRPDVKKKLLDDRFDAKTYQRTYTTKDDCVSGDNRQYEGGVEDDGTFWEDDPLSYSYNKELSSTVKGWVATGNEFLNKLESGGDLFYTDLRRWGREMFDTAGI